MTLYYVLKHGYRFSAEIFFELQRAKQALSQWNDIYIASIGCGPCTELFGALSFWRSIGKHDESFHYRGFDTEQLWLPLMNQVKSYFPTANVDTSCQDAFDYYMFSDERVDVIILNYMLSDMQKFRPEEYGKFLDNLISFARNKGVRYIFVNDIYLKMSLSASGDLLNALNNSGVRYSFTAGQYHGYNNFIGLYRETMSQPQFDMPNKAIVNKYNPFNTVNSIQTIIKFQ